jgi:hypothetical protein
LCHAQHTSALLLLLLLLSQELFYEGSGSNAELILSLILAATLVYIPITIAIVGKRLWIKYRSAAQAASVLPQLSALQGCDCHWQLALKALRVLWCIKGHAP